MASITPVDVGAAPNDGNGDPLRTAFQKLNTNDSNINAELAGAVQSPVVTADVQDNAVTFPKMQNIATQTIMGRTTAATGDPEALTATQARGVMSVNEASTVPLISTEDELAGQMQIAVVATLPGSPDASTVYFVTT